jgi:hypothetical protein
MPKYQYANITAAIILFLSISLKKIEYIFPSYYEKNKKKIELIKKFIIAIGILIIGCAFLKYGIHVPLTTYHRGGDFASYYAGATEIKNGNNLYRDLAFFNVEVEKTRALENYFTPSTFDSAASKRLKEVLDSNGIEAIGPFTYPPFNYIFFIPWTLIEWRLAFKVWVFINLLLIILSIYFYAKTKGVNFGFNDYFLVGILAAMFHPLTFSQWENQINILVLFLLVLSYYFFKKDKPAFVALSLAFAIHIKVFPVIMVGYFLWKRKWNVVGWTIVFFIGIIVFIGIISEFSLFFDYVSIVFPKWMGYLRPFDMNQSFNGFFSRIFFTGEGFKAIYENAALAKLLIYICSITVIVITILFCRNKIEDNEKLFDLEYGLVIVGSQLCSSWVLLHHLTWYLLPLMIIYRYYKDNLKSSTALPVLVAISSMLIGFRYEYGIPEYKIGMSIFMISIKFYGMILLWMSFLITIIIERKHSNKSS